MAFFIDHDRITFRVLSSSQHPLGVEEGPQLEQCIHRDAGFLFDHYGLATAFVEHPAGHHESQVDFILHDDPWFFTGSQVSNYLNFTIKKRMEPIPDSSQAELMSSVLMP